MQFVHIFMILAGLAMIAWGFWAADRLKNPWNIVGALFAPGGLVVALLGVLLLCVPNFFRG